MKREIDQALFAPVNFSEIGARSDLADLIPNPVRQERRLRVIQNNAFLAVEPALTLVDLGDLATLQLSLNKALLAIHARNLSPEEARVELLKTVPQLLAANKCPDFIEDEGHYFGTDLPDDDKRALIEYMKTF